MENSESDTSSHILILKTGHTTFLLALLHDQLILFFVKFFLIFAIIHSFVYNVSKSDNVYSFIDTYQETTQKGEYWKKRLKYFNVLLGEN